MDALRLRCSHIWIYEVICNCFFSYYNYLLLQSNDKSKSSGNGGPTQRASALAALSSAFNPSSKAKLANTIPTRPSQGSQRAAAVAALSTVLTAEQKGSSETSIPRFSRSSHSPEKTVTGKMIFFFIYLFDKATSLEANIFLLLSFLRNRMYFSLYESYCLAIKSLRYMSLSLN